MNKIVSVPSVELSVNLRFDQKEECIKCLSELLSIADDMIKPETKTYNEIEFGGIDTYRGGYYFDIHISLKEPELIRAITNKILEYSVQE